MFAADALLIMLFWFLLFLLVSAAIYRWVFRINEIVDELKKHTSLLERILEKLNK